MKHTFCRMPMFTILALLLVGGRVANAYDFRVTPYIQNPAEDAMTVTWFSDANTAEFLTIDGTDYPSTPALASDLAYHASEISSFFGGVDPGSPYMHRVRVSGLTAGTQYNYSVTQGTTVHESSLRTTPTKASGSSVRFMVYADSETEPESTGKTKRWSEPYGNWDRQYVVDQTEGYKQNINVMKSRNPDFIAIAGDLVESGNEQRDWDEFWKHNAGPYNNIAGTTPILPVPGNHENHAGTHGGGGSYEATKAQAAIARYQTYFETPDNGSGKAEHDDRYYRVDYGAVTYISIDCTNGKPHETDKDTNWYLYGEGETDPRDSTDGEVPDFNPGSTQYAWLESQLVDAKSKNQVTFVQFHHVPYSVGPHGFPTGNGEFSNGEDTQSGVPTRVLSPLFEDYGVAAVLCGHDEMYEHSIVNGIHYFDLGSAGDGLRGPYMGEDGKYRTDMDNPYQVFLAHLDAPEVWSGNQLISGGKHYTHMEINVTQDENGFWVAELSPVYIFPLMDSSGNITGWERRVYDDVTTVTVVPEPGMMLLLAAGGLAVLLRRCAASRRHLILP